MARVYVYRRAHSLPGVGERIGRHTVGGVDCSVVLLSNLFSIASREIPSVEEASEKPIGKEVVGTGEKPFPGIVRRYYSNVQGCYENSIQDAREHGLANHRRHQCVVSISVVRKSEYEQTGKGPSFELRVSR